MTHEWTQMNTNHCRFKVQVGHKDHLSAPVGWRATVPRKEPIKVKGQHSSHAASVLAIFMHFIHDHGYVSIKSSTLQQIQNTNSLFPEIVLRKIWSKSKRTFLTYPM